MSAGICPTPCAAAAGLRAVTVTDPHTFHNPLAAPRHSLQSTLHRPWRNTVHSCTGLYTLTSAQRLVYFTLMVTGVATLLSSLLSSYKCHTTSEQQVSAVRTQYVTVCVQKKIRTERRVCFQLQIQALRLTVCRLDAINVTPLSWDRPL